MNSCEAEQKREGHNAAVLVSTEQKGMDKGKQKGKQELQIARNMLKEGIPPETILHLPDLTFSALKTLLDN